MAGGGSSEIVELREMVQGVIAEMEARIVELEQLLMTVTDSGSKSSPKKTASSKKKRKSKADVRESPQF